LEGDIDLAPSQTFTRSVVLDKVLDGVHVDLMKVDVEGAEQFVLKGASNLIARSRPTIISEFSEQLRGVSNVSPLEYASTLVSSGYSLTVLWSDGGIEECGRNPQAVCEALEKRNLGVIDVLATPI
jgi:hypothetical protein